MESSVSIESIIIPTSKLDDLKDRIKKRRQLLSNKERFIEKMNEFNLYEKKTISKLMEKIKKPENCNNIFSIDFIKPSIIKILENNGYKIEYEYNHKNYFFDELILSLMDTAKKWEKYDENIFNSRLYDILLDIKLIVIIPL